MEHTIGSFVTEVELSDRAAVRHKLLDLSGALLNLVGSNPARSDKNSFGDIWR